MDAEGRAEVLAEAKQRFGDYAPQVWQLRDRVEALDRADEPAEVGAESEGGDS